MLDCVVALHILVAVDQKWLLDMDTGYELELEVQDVCVGGLGYAC